MQIWRLSLRMIVRRAPATITFGTARAGNLFHPTSVTAARSGVAAVAVALLVILFLSIL